MKKSLIALLAVTAGCIPSLHPLYTDQDIVTDDALVGTFVGDDDSSSWTFTRGDNRSYTLVVTEEEGKQGTFTVRIVELGDARFLDFYPQDPPENSIAGFYWMHRVPAHSFLRVEFKEDTLNLTPLKPDWLKEHLEAHPDAVDHMFVDEYPVFTAPTAQLREFVEECLKVEGAFSDPIVLKKKDGQTPAPTDG